MDINDLRGTVLQRFQELTDEEKGIFDTIMDSPVGTVINKLVGPELEQIFSEPESETDRMLADDMPKRFGTRERDMPQDMPRDMPRDMSQGMPRDMPVDDMPQAMEREMASR